MNAPAITDVVPSAQLASNFGMIGMNPEASFYPGRQVVAKAGGLFSEVDPKFREIYINQVCGRIPGTRFGLHHLMVDAGPVEVIEILRDLGGAVSPYHFYEFLRHTPEALLPLLMPQKSLLVRLSTNTVHDVVTEVVLNRQLGHKLKMHKDDEVIIPKDSLLFVSLGEL